MKMKLKYILMILPAVACDITAQTSWEVSPLLQSYKKGEAMFREGNYRGSRDITSEFAERGEDFPILQNRAKFMVAEAAYRAGDKDAAQLLTDFIRNGYDPENRQQAELLLGNLYLTAGDYDRAAAEYEKINPRELVREDREELSLKKGIIMFKEGRYDEAMPLFSDLANQSIKYRNDGIFYKACIDYKNGDYIDAEKGFEKLKQDKAYGKESQYYLTGIYFAGKRYQQALSAGERLLDTDYDGGHKAELMRICGESAFMTGNRDKCISYLKQYRLQTPVPDGNALYMLGVSYYMDGRYGDAIKVLGEIDGGDEALTQSAYLYLGHSYIATGDKDGALLAYERAAEPDADMQAKETALYDYALLLNETSLISFEKSVQAFEKYLNLFPDSKNAAAINELLVERYFTTHNYDAALASINKIKRPSTTILKAKQAILYRMGSEAYINGRDDEAYKLFTQAINMGNYDPGVVGKASFWRGEIAYRNKRYADASADFSRHLKASSESDPTAYYNLGYIKFKTASYNDALDYFDSYVKNIPADGNAKVTADAWNRIGDCRYMAKNYSGAGQAYAKAMELSPATGDYALYRQGLIAGVQKRPTDKVTIMKRLTGEYPDSPYAPNAMLEEGLAFLELGKTTEAAGCFDNLYTKYPQSGAARTGSLQTAMTYINRGETEKATAAYKKVIETYPGSEEAKIAANDLKNIYVQRGDISSYTEYIKKTGNGMVKYDASEMDSLTFLAAENGFLKSPGEKSVAKFTEYMQNYPDGAFTADAAFYTGKYRYESGDVEKSRAQLEKVIHAQGSRFAPDALEILADMEEKGGNYKSAQQYYRELAVKAASPETIRRAKTGDMRMSAALKDYNSVITEATVLLKGNLPDDAAKEALYLRAGAYSAEGKGVEAAADWEKLSSEPRSAYGAEASYRLGQYRMDNKDMKGAEEIVNKLISAGSSNKYWVARGIILLSDISAAKGDKFKAKQYLKSLDSNYEGNDDIKKLINDRINKY